MHADCHSLRRLHPMTRLPAPLHTRDSQPPTLRVTLAIALTLALFVYHLARWQASACSEENGLQMPTMSTLTSPSLGTSKTCDAVHRISPPQSM
jgi:hypothetical protein